MNIKITVHIYADVEGESEAQDLCNTLDLGLENRIDGLPVGEMLGVKVDNYSKATDEELAAEGLVE